jgi:hypothetical protein
MMNNHFHGWSWLRERAAAHCPRGLLYPTCDADCDPTAICAERKERVDFETSPPWTCVGVNEVPTADVWKTCTNQGIDARGACDYFVSIVRFGSDRAGGAVLRANLDDVPGVREGAAAYQKGLSSGEKEATPTVQWVGGEEGGKVPEQWAMLAKRWSYPYAHDLAMCFNMTWFSALGHTQPARKEREEKIVFRHRQDESCIRRAKKAWRAHAGNKRSPKARSAQKAHREPQLLYQLFEACEVIDLEEASEEASQEAEEEEEEEEEEEDPTNPRTWKQGAAAGGKTA